MNKKGSGDKMFYTCTMNPAIDLFVSTKEYDPFVVNRATEDEVQPNGKGVNVSFILKMLGIHNQALGFSGGFTGKFIEEELENKDIETNFVKVEGNTRINVFTHVETKETEYKLVNKGPEINLQQIQELLKKIKSLNSEDTLFVSGSNPRGVTDEVILEIAKLSKKNNFKLVLDTSSKVVLDSLEYQLYCIKPNDEELASWFGKEKLSWEELIYYGKKLINQGTKMVLISLGEKGCLFFSKKETLFVNAPKGKVINTACSGDTLLATFIGSLKLGWSTQESLRHAVAAGSSTAFTSGLTDFKNVEELKKNLVVKKITDRMERNDYVNI
ncbi:MULTISPECIES: 1-phosphofructokinase [Alkalibacterium]|uniref:1-phosphofructokinase n=1 Tax=Alkalibacterium TaxID=99906 RepID=UPI002647393F|nr:1-phosphofructokinase [Alkalibacterium sp.]MDN6293863.1 1-phosphofructokinase [Alkalibacterium sp.]